MSLITEYLSNYLWIFYIALAINLSYLQLILVSCSQLLLDDFAVLFKMFFEFRVLHSVHSLCNFISYDLQILSSFADLSVFPGLVCDFCPSDQEFAYSFIQISPHSEHPCFRLYPSHYRADSGL